MAITAIISVLGISAFLGARDQALVSDRTEKILAAIREAQNRAISITNSRNTPSGSDTVVWGVRLDSPRNQADLVYIDILNSGAPMPLLGVQESVTDNSAATIKTYYVSTSGESTDAAQRYLMYSSPFARTTTSTDSCTSGGTCVWRESTNPSRDWELNTGSGFVSPSDYIKIVISYKDRSETIRVTSKGDSYIE